MADDEEEELLPFARGDSLTKLTCTYNKGQPTRANPNTATTISHFPENNNSSYNGRHSTTSNDNSDRHRQTNEASNNSNNNSSSTSVLEDSTNLSLNGSLSIMDASMTGVSFSDLSLTTSASAALPSSSRQARFCSVLEMEGLDSSYEIKADPENKEEGEDSVGGILFMPEDDTFREEEEMFDSLSNTTVVHKNQHQYPSILHTHNTTGNCQQTSTVNNNSDFAFGCGPGNMKKVIRFSMGVKVAKDAIWKKNTDKSSNPNRNRRKTNKPTDSVPAHSGAEKQAQCKKLKGGEENKQKETNHFFLAPLLKQTGLGDLDAFAGLMAKDQETTTESSPVVIKRKNHYHFGELEK